MSAHPAMLGLVGGLIVLLTIATVIGHGLARRVEAAGPHPTITNLNARIEAWWVMVGLAGTALVLGPRAVTVLFAVLSFAALRELMTLTRLSAADHWSLVVAFFVAVPLQYALVWIDWYGLYSIMIPVYAFVLMPIISALRGQPRAFLGRIAEAQWALMTAVYCLSHVPALAMLEFEERDGQGLALAAFLLLVVQMSDVFQYVWGLAVGKRKIAPALSPSKTVEGAVLGIASATALGTALWWLTPFSPWQAAGLSAVTTSLGFLGGLVMSAIKRDRGVKDWGWIIQGHGGVLDRLDSVVFAAPVFFHLTRYGWAG